MRLALAIGLALLARTVPAAQEGDATPPARPNVLLILADDLGWKDVSYSGSAYPTPRIDRLASEGLVFTQAYSAAPSCSPTRAALYTGRSPTRLGITRAIRAKDYRAEGTAHTVGEGWRWPFLPYPNGTHLPDGVPTFADRLRSAGYETAFIGKWHLGRPDHAPSEHGFEEESFVGNVGINYFPPYRIKQAGPTEPGEYLTDRLTDEAVAFLERAHERPFCLVLSHFAVHTPTQGRPDLVREFEKKLVPGTPQSNAEYAAMVWSLDQSVGRLLDTLEAKELAANTLVILVSDNGPLVAGDRPLTSVAPLRGGKLDCYEGGLRVPMVVRWPGHTRAGTSTDTPVVSMDLYPTIVAAAGLPLASETALEGLDLAPLWQGGTLERERLYFFVPHREAQAAVRAGDWKLIHFFTGRNELYDLARDPGESLDLVASEPERAKALDAELLTWIRAAGCALPEPNPHHDPEWVRQHDQGEDSDEDE